MTKTELFIKAWRYAQFESSSGKTAQFAAFAGGFKRAIVSQLEDGDEVKFNVGHFYVSGFVRRGESYVYFSTSDVRHFPGEWLHNVLIRTAKGFSDYTGGRNQRTDLKNFGAVAEQIFTGAAFMILA